MRLCLRLYESLNANTDAFARCAFVTGSVKWLKGVTVASVSVTLATVTTGIKRVLLISASIGGGHVAAAKALESAFAAQGAAVQHVDLLDYTTPPFRRLYRQAYFDLVRTAPDLIDWLGKRMDKAPKEQKSAQQRLRARMTRLISYHLPRLIRQYNPDVLVHTHFLPAEILSAQQHKFSVPQAVVVTDFAAHSLWLQPNISRYFVATDEVKVHMQAAGIETERITVSGIPVDQRFAHLESKAAARAALGHPLERDMLLIMAGGLDRKVLLTIVEQLKGLKWPLSTHIICGRSSSLMQAVTSALDKYQDDSTNLVSVELTGFTNNVPRYMAAADLIVGKPGGLTSSEALAAGLPFAVVQPYPIQEEANTNYLLEYGAAMRIEPLTLFNHKIKSFFEDDTKRANMRQAAAKLARPDAANTVVQAVLTELIDPK